MIRNKQQNHLPIIEEGLRPTFALLTTPELLQIIIHPDKQQTALLVPPLYRRKIIPSTPRSFPINNPSSSITPDLVSHASSICSSITSICHLASDVTSPVSPPSKTLYVSFPPSTSSFSDISMHLPESPKNYGFHIHAEVSHTCSPSHHPFHTSPTRYQVTAVTFSAAQSVCETPLITT